MVSWQIWFYLDACSNFWLDWTWSLLEIIARIAGGHETFSGSTLQRLFLNLVGFVQPLKYSLQRHLFALLALICVELLNHFRGLSDFCWLELFEEWLSAHVRRNSLGNILLEMSNAIEGFNANESHKIGWVHWVYVRELIRLLLSEGRETQISRAIGWSYHIFYRLGMFFTSEYWFWSIVFFVAIFIEFTKDSPALSKTGESESAVTHDLLWTEFLLESFLFTKVFRALVGVAFLRECLCHSMPEISQIIDEVWFIDTSSQQNFFDLLLISGSKFMCITDMRLVVSRHWYRFFAFKLSQPALSVLPDTVLLLLKVEVLGQLRVAQLWRGIRRLGWKLIRRLIGCEPTCWHLLFLFSSQVAWREGWGFWSSSDHWYALLWRHEVYCLYTCTLHHRLTFNLRVYCVQIDRESPRNVRYILDLCPLGMNGLLR